MPEGVRHGWGKIRKIRIEVVDGAGKIVDYGGPGAKGFRPDELGVRLWRFASES